MICPHCGRSTNAADICQHCHKPTEFTSRSNFRPGPIPGLDDSPVPPPRPVKPPKKGSRAVQCVVLLCIAMSALACVLSIFCLLQIGRISGKDELPPESASESESMPIAGCKVTFDRNWLDGGEEIPSIARGQTLPVLPDQESFLFSGWNTRPDGGGTSFRPGEIFDLVLQEDLTLFAQWEPMSAEATQGETTSPPPETASDTNTTTVTTDTNPTMGTSSPTEDE